MNRTLLFLIALLASTALFADTVIRCESDNNTRHNCRFDGIGNVTLQRQFSRNACVEGRSWGFNDRGIWVDRGCRAEFTLGGHGGGGGDSNYGRRDETITCESENNRTHRCSVNTRGGVRLSRQLSRNACTYGST